MRNTRPYWIAKQIWDVGSGAEFWGQATANDVKQNLSKKKTYQIILNGSGEH